MERTRSCCRPKQVIVPAPADPLAPNIILEEPLASSHAAGTATTLVNVVLSAPLSLPHATGVVVANPRPLIASSTATTLRALLQQAEDAAGAGNTAAAIAALRQFKAAVLSDPGAGRRDEPADKPKARAALIERGRRARRPGEGQGSSTPPASA